MLELQNITKRFNAGTVDEATVLTDSTSKWRTESLYP